MKVLLPTGQKVACQEMGGQSLSGCSMEISGKRFKGYRSRVQRLTVRNNIEKKGKVKRNRQFLGMDWSENAWYILDTGAVVAPGVGRYQVDVS